MWQLELVGATFSPILYHVMQLRLPFARVLSLAPRILSHAYASRGPELGGGEVEVRSTARANVLVSEPLAPGSSSPRHAASAPYPLQRSVDIVSSARGYRCSPERYWHAMRSVVHLEALQVSRGQRSLRAALVLGPAPAPALPPARHRPSVLLLPMRSIRGHLAFGRNGATRRPVVLVRHCRLSTAPGIHLPPSLCASMILSPLTLPHAPRRSLARPPASGYAPRLFDCQ